MLLPSIVHAAQAAPSGAAAEFTPPRGRQDRSDAQFRRIFVPADRIGDVTQGHERFLPIRRDEFERLTAGDRRGTERPEVRITRAHFRAQLEGNQLVQGSARLEVHHTGAPAWLTLQTEGLGVSALRWQDGRRASAGTYFGNGQKRVEHGIIVAAPGAAELAWTASGRRIADGTEFRLTFPQAATTELVVVAAKTAQLSVNGATIVSQSADESGGVTYRLAVRGGTPFSLRATESPALASRTRIAARHTTTYTVTASATQVDSQLRIIPFSQPVRQFGVLVPSPLQVLSLTIGGQPLAFTERPAPGDVDQKLLAIDLGQPLPAGETELRVRGMTATALERTTTLPAVQLQQSTWLGGTVHVAVQDDLQLKDLAHVGFRAGEGDVRSTTPGRWTFEQMIPSASLELRMGRAAKRLAAQALTSVEIGRDDVVADTTVDLTSHHGAESIIRAQVSADWDISSVESQPAGLVRSWSTEEGTRDRFALIVLNQPVSPDHPIRLRFKGRRQRPPEGAGLSSGQLMFMHFPHLDRVEHWLEVVSGNMLEIVPEGTASAEAVAVGDLPPGLRGLVSERANAYLLAVLPQGHEVSFRTSTRSAELDADIELEAEVVGSVVRYAYRIHLEPQSGAVARLALVFSDAPGATPQWRFLDRSGRDVAAERVTDGKDAASAGQSEARAFRWRLVQPQAEPFELLISFEHEWDRVSALILAAVESAGRQSGIVHLSADRSLKLAIENLGLEPLTLPPASDKSRARASAAYRFQPERVIRSEAGSLLVIRRVDQDELTPRAWIRTARVDSLYLPNGRISHHLSISLESNAPEQLGVFLPRADQVLYRTRDCAWRQVERDSADGSVKIPLTGGSGPVPLEVRFSQRRRPLGTFTKVDPVTLEFSVPVGLIDHHQWIPHGYRELALASPAERLLAAFSVLVDPLAIGESSPSRKGVPDDRPAAELRDLQAAEVGGTAVQFAHLATLRQWCLVMFIGGLLLGTYLAENRARLAVSAAAGGLAGALLLPVAYAPLASALAWGCLAAVVVRIVITPVWSLGRQLMAGERRPQEVAATTAVLLVGVLALSPRAYPADAATAAEPPASIHRVIVPIDENRQPTGDHVFVPESLYSLLLHQEQERQAPLGQWLITQCRLRGAMAESTGAAAPSPQAFALTVELETFHRNAEIRLPLSREQSGAQPTSLRLDGTTPANWWGEDGQSLYVRIPQPGPHDLELMIVPHILRKGGTRELSLPLVPAQECFVELSVPQDMPQLTFPGVQGEIKYSPGASMYRGYVGSVRELVVNWPVTGGSSTSNVQADLLTWMYVQRTVTLVEQRLVIHSEGDEPLYVDVVPPAGVRYLSSAHDLPHASISASGSGRVSLVIQAREPESVVVPLQFLYEHPSGMGTLSVPRFSVEGGVQIADRWLAVQAAPGVLIRPEPGASARVVQAGEFLDRWGPADALPMVAFRETVDASSWRMGVEPEDPRVEATESTTAVATPSGIGVVYRADCRVPQGSILLQRLDVSNRLIVSSVELIKAGQIHPAQWSETNDGRLRILLPEPTSGSFTVLVKGDVPADEVGGIALPILKLDAVKNNPPRLTVARTAHTVLQLDRSDGLQPVANASLPESWQDDWYLHGQYTWSGSQGGASFVRGEVRRADAPREVRTVTTLTPDLGGWVVSVPCLLRGIRQPLDRLVFIAPQEWEGPIAVDPPGRWRIAVEGGSRQKRIILTPLAPTGDEVRLTLEGQLAEGWQDRVTIPAIRLVEPAADDALVALPQSTSGQETAWETQHLRRVDDAPAAREMLPDARNWLLFRATAEPATARVNLLEQSPSAPLVSFVENVVHWKRGRRVYGETTFTLDPRGRRSCEVNIPKGYRLLGVHVNDRRLSAVRAAPRRWEVQLESSQLPQLITVTCQSDAFIAGKVLDLHAPLLVADGTPILVLQTAWALRSNTPLERSETGTDGATPISGSLLAAVRIANLVESLDEIMPALVGSPTETWTRWLAYWRGRIGAAQDQFARRALAEPPDEEAAQAFQTAQQRLARITETLPQLPPPGGMDSADSERGTAALSLPNHGWDRFHLRLLGDGRIDTVRIQTTTAGRDATVQRMLGTLLLGLIGIALATSHRQDAGWSRTDLPLVLLFIGAMAALFSGSLTWEIAVLAAASFLFGWSVRRRLPAAEGGRSRS